MRNLFVTLALVAGVIAPATGASAAVAPTAPTGSIGIRLVDAPNDRRTEARAKLYIVDHVKPGTTISRRIEVGNATGQTQDVGLYASAATISKGLFTVAEAHTPNELTTWTALDRSTAKVPEGGTAIVRVTITVPRNASSGERYGVAWAEIRSAPPTGGGVTQVNRVGIRIYLSVGPGGEPASNFSITALTAKRLPNGQPVVLASVQNTGGRALDMSGTLKLSDGPGGLAAGPFPATLGTSLGVGQSELVTIPLDKSLPTGPWHARIDLKSGLIARSAQGTITFPTAGVAKPVKVEPVSGGIPWWLIGAAAFGLLLLGLLLFLILRRRRDKRGVEDEAVPSPAKHAAVG